MEYALASEFAGAKPEDFTIVKNGSPAPKQEPVIEQEIPKEEPKIEELPKQEEPVKEEPVKEEPIKEIPKDEPIKDEPKVEEQKPAAVIEEKKPEPKKEEPVKTRDELLKDLGLDEFTIGLIKYKETVGDVTPYLEAKTVNYKDMPAEEVMRRDLREKYPNLSKESFERLVYKQVTEKYNLDSDVASEEDTALGKELMAHDAEQTRQRFIDRQNQFKAPEKQPDDSAQKQQEAIKAQEKQIQEQQEAFKQQILTDVHTQSLLKDKRLVLNSGDKEYEYKFDVGNPQDVVNMLIDGGEYQKHITKADGTPDSAKLLRIAAYAANEEQIIKSLINHGKTLGGKKIVEENLEHTEKRENVPAQTEETLWDAFKNRGVKSWNK